MKPILITLALFVALCVAWIAWPTRSTSERLAPVSVEAEPPSAHELPGTYKAAPEGARIALTQEVTPPAVASETGDLVSMRSREGFTLRSIEVARPDGGWRRIALVEGAVPRAELATAHSVRAPGHRPQVVDHAANEITLDADALLIVECVDLVATLSAVQEWNLHVAESTGPGSPVYCVQRLGPNRVGLAVTCEDARTDGAPVAVQVPLVWSSGLKGTINFNAHADAREHWDLPCPPIARTARLVVTLDAPSGLVLGPCFVSISAERGGTEPATHTQSETLNFPLGSLELHKPPTSNSGESKESEVSEDGPQRVAFNSITLGGRLRLTARDSTSKAWAVVSFVHDGGELHVTLHPPFVLTGRIAPSDPSFWSSKPRIEWALRYESDGEPAMGSSYSLNDAGESGAVLHENGVFELRGPDPFFDEGEPGDALPRIVDVTVSGLGFGPASKHLVMDAAGRADCGVIEIADAKPDLRVLLDGTEKQPLVTAGRALTVQREDGTCQSYQVVRVREHDGFLDVFVSDTSGDDGQRGRDRWFMNSISGPTAEPLQVPPAVRFLTSPRSHELRGFRCVEGNTFRAVPSADYDLTVETAGKQPGIGCGLAWMGITDTSGWSATLGGRRITSNSILSAPATDLGVWWRPQDGVWLLGNRAGDIADGSWAPIQPGTSRVVIPEIEGAK
jgi:hypothetical protein